MDNDVDDDDVGGDVSEMLNIVCMLELFEVGKWYF
jgi:hypothetical protein